MKQILSIFISLIICSMTYGQSSDSLKIVELQTKLDALVQSNQELSSANTSMNREISDLTQQISNLTRDLASLRSSVRANTTAISNIDEKVVANSKQITSSTSSLDAKIDASNKDTQEQVAAVDAKTDSVSQTLSNKSTWLTGGIALVFVILLSLSIILNRKGSTKIESLKKAAEELNNKILAQMSTELGEMQKIAASIGSLSNTSSPDSERSLILALADRITFMEMTLYKMDSSVRGYKQLTKAIAAMKDNLLANGYEIVEMLGKAYHEGMKVTANFVEDESLEPGQQIITGIIKPQINYRGKMIQVAQITVSQN